MFFEVMFIQLSPYFVGSLCSGEPDPVNALNTMKYGGASCLKAATSIFRSYLNFGPIWSLSHVVLISYALYTHLLIQTRLGVALCLISRRQWVPSIYLRERIEG